MLLHADAVAKNRPAGVRTGRIHRDNADPTLVFAITACQLINQRALPRPGRPRQAEHTRFPAVREQRFQQIGPSRRPVFYN